MEKVESIFTKYVALGLFDLIKTFVSEMGDFERAAFKGYSLISERRFKDEFFVTEHYEKLREIFSRKHSKFEDLKGPKLPPLYQELQEKFTQSIAVMLLFNHSVTPRQACELFQSIFREKGVDVFRFTCEKIQKTYAEDEVIQSIIEAALENAPVGFSKGYNRDPLFQKEEVREIISKEDYTLMFTFILKQAKTT